MDDSWSTYATAGAKSSKSNAPKDSSDSEDDEPTFTYLNVKDERQPVFDPSEEPKHAPAYLCYPQQAQHPHQHQYPQQYQAQQNYATYAPNSAQAAAPMPYHQYTCYPTTATSAAMPYNCYPMTSAVAPANPAIEPAKEDRSSKQSLWIGRTKAQVLADNTKIAEREGVLKYNPIKPSGAAPDQMFWVVELNGDTTLRDYQTIDGDLGPGKWERDARYGNAYFVREKEEDKK